MSTSGSVISGILKMGDSLFSIDIVRDFIRDRGGRVRNHELVAHFKRFLNDPVNKATNRAKFKDYVNTLASVKLDENGEKVLVLKKRFQDGSLAATPSRGADIQERGPRVEIQRPKAKLRKTFEATPTRPDSPPEKLPSAASVAPLPAPEELSQTAQLPDESMEAVIPMDHSGMSTMLESDYRDDTESIHMSHSDVIASGAGDDSVFLGPSPGESNTDADSTSSSVLLQGAPQGESSTDEVKVTGEAMQLGSPVGESSTDTPLLEEGEETGEFSTPVNDRIASVTAEEGEAGKPSTPISVKDRARHLNKMTSETDLITPTNSTPTAKSKLRHIGRNADEDSNSVSSVGIAMDQLDREWMITCATSDYHAMFKLLQQNPKLAPKRDFISTALHWAAKHGNMDVIKLLCGNGNILINTQSGYTALHLASMQGHDDVIHQLVQVYQADPNVRDFSGKKAKQYLRNSASSTTHQMLQARRLGPLQTTGFRRQGSYSTKIQKSGFFGIPTTAAMRNSWQGDPQSDRDRSSPSPSPSPKTSPGSGRKQMKTKDHLVPKSPRWPRRGSPTNGLYDYDSPPESPRPSTRPKLSSKSPTPSSPFHFPGFHELSSSQSYPKLTGSGDANDAIKTILSPFASKPSANPPRRRISLQDDMMMPPPKQVPTKRKKKKSQADLSHASSDSDVHMQRSGSEPEMMMKASKSQFI